MNWEDYEGRPPLHCAVTQGSEAVVAAIVKVSPRPLTPQSPSCMVNARDQQQRSALHWAAVAGRSQVVAILLGRGARADMADEAGATPVHLAVTSGSAATLRVFVEGGLGDTVDQEGRTPTMWAGGGFSSLPSAVMGKEDLLTVLQGVNVDHVDKQVDTNTAKHVWRP